MPAGLRTVSSSTTGSLLNTYAGFGPGEAGSSCSGNVNVGLAVVAPLSVTAGPETCVQEYDSAVVDRDPSRATARPRCTVWSTPASAAGAVRLITSIVTVVGTAGPPGPVTVSVNAYVPISVGVKPAEAVSAPVRVTDGPETCCHAYESISPVDAVLSSVTCAPSTAGVPAVAAATGAAGRKNAPDPVGTVVAEPPADEVTVIEAGGAATPVNGEFDSGPKPGTVSAGGFTALLSLELASTVSVCASESYRSLLNRTMSVSALVLCVTGRSLELITSMLCPGVIGLVIGNRP